MRAEKFYEGNLLLEIESRDQAVLTACDLETHTVAVQDLCFRKGASDVGHCAGSQDFDRLMPSQQRRLCLRMKDRKLTQLTECDDPHVRSSACFQHENKVCR